MDFIYGLYNRELEEARKNLTLKFTSGNVIPVTQATITSDEWEVIDRALTDFTKLQRKRL